MCKVPMRILDSNFPLFFFLFVPQILLTFFQKESNYNSEYTIGADPSAA